MGQGPSRLAYRVLRHDPNRYLGETIDIHCGGKDLVFPHHENEIAQSEGATGKPFVHYWMHNGFINVDNQKMSKSLGNFFTVREASPAVRPGLQCACSCSCAQYRSPLNYSREMIDAGQGLAGSPAHRARHTISSPALQNGRRTASWARSELALMDKG
ncbi:MAG: hypothetical protein ACLVB5_07590 [Christensenellales bacterium]